MSSTMLTRDESNVGWSRKEGLKGVPITLKVPTHLELTVHERHYLYNGEKSVERLKLSYPVRQVDHKFVMGEKIFTVDFKRPAGGTFGLTLDFSAAQGLTGLAHEIEDQTIAQVADALDSATFDTTAPTAPTSIAKADTPKEETSKYDNKFYTVDSVVAVQMFELDAPDFEEQIAEFLNLHLNQAHDAWVTPPAVTQFHRVGLSGMNEHGDIPRGSLPTADAGSYSADTLPPVVDRRRERLSSQNR